MAIAVALTGAAACLAGGGLACRGGTAPGTSAALAPAINSVVTAAASTTVPDWNTTPSSGHVYIAQEFSFGQPFLDGLALVGIGGEDGDHWA